LRKMKKVLAMLLTFAMCLGMCACGGAQKDDDSIELTIGNYNDYLDINMTIANYVDPEDPYAYYYPTDIKNSHGDIVGYGYTEVKFGFEVEGVSSNYNYNDVVITGRFNGDYEGFSFWWDENDDYISIDEPFEFDITVKTNIAGNGDNFYILEMDGNHPKGHYYTSKDYFKCDFEVVEVSGTVTPAK